MDSMILVPVKRENACIHCKGLLRDALQTEKHQRVCEACFADIKRTFASNKNFYSFFFGLVYFVIGLGRSGYAGKRCPDCNLDATTKCHVDEAARRAVLSAKVYCSQRDTGCPWTGLPQQHKQHQAVCSYRATSALASDKRGGSKKTCVHCKQAPADAVQTPNGEILCEGCFKDIEGYPDQHCQECGVTAEHNKYHVDKAVRREVAAYIQQCHWGPQGCTWRGPHREYGGHLQSCKFTDFVVCGHNGCKMRLPCARLHKHELRFEFRTIKCYKCHDQVPFYQLVDHNSGKCRRDGSRYDFSPVPFQKLVEDEGGAIVMLNPPARMLQYATARQDYVNAVPIRLLMVPTEVTLGRKDGQCDALGEDAFRRQEVERLDHNGTLLWPIERYSERRREAIETNLTSIQSPPFYTGRSGYKMCIRAYLNGDGEGLNSHISVHFVVMKGVYDNLLKWPFDSKVSLIIPDQATKRHPITKVFYPPHDDQSFKQPESDTNIAAKVFQKFAKFEDLSEKGYVKDDKIFIKCIVDTTNIFQP